MDNPKQYTVSHSDLASIYPLFKTVINPPERTLGQFSHAAGNFLLAHESHGRIETMPGYLKDNDDTEYVSRVLMDNKADYEAFMHYIKTHVAISLIHEHPDEIRGLEENIISIQRAYNARGPFMSERMSSGGYHVPPVLFKAPHKYEDNIEVFASLLTLELRSAVPGTDIALSYVGMNNGLYD
jgi:hypothetical protein